MWKYLKPYIGYAIVAALMIVLEIILDLLQPRIMSDIVDIGVLGIDNDGQGNFEYVYHWGLIMLSLTAAGGLCSMLNNICVAVASQRIGNRIREDCFRRIMSLSIAQIEGYGSGTLITRLTNDISQIQNYIAHFLRGLVRTAMLTFGSIYFLFVLHSNFGYLALCAFPLILGVILYCLHRATPFFVRLQSELDMLNSVLQEDVNAMRLIKSCVRELYEKQRFSQYNRSLVGTQLRTLLIFAFMDPTVHFILDITVAFLLAMGDYDVRLGTATPGMIMAAITYTVTMMHGILLLVMVFQNISRGSVSWQRVCTLLEDKPELKDGTETETICSANAIEFRNVSFTYPGKERPVLNNVSLKINPGETLAIMGSTGSGKSTLAWLIPRFYEASSGKVLVGGRDVREYKLNALREHISIALQHTDLFSDTIEANVRWGADNVEAEELAKAIEISQSREFIFKLEKDLQTVLEERGNSLSGGQKQRLGIARALLKNADILILDDATSALDLKTEAKLYEMLRQYRPKCTKVIVAQRVASARWADRIAVFDRGRLMGCAPHEELLRTCSTYQDIYASQMGTDGDDVSK